MYGESATTFQTLQCSRAWIDASQIRTVMVVAAIAFVGVSSSANGCSFNQLSMVRWQSGAQHSFCGLTARCGQELQVS